ncbi:MAG: toll/interleukin-1 receptor domain-containing protein [Pseudomonadota bacterium]
MSQSEPLVVEVEASNTGEQGATPVAKMRYYHIHLRVGGGDVTGDGIYQCILSYMGSGLAEGSGEILCYTDRIQGVINVEGISMDPPAEAKYDSDGGPYRSRCSYSISGPNPLYIRGEIKARYAISRTQGLLGLHIPYDTEEATFVIDMSESAIKLPPDAEAKVIQVIQGKPVFDKPNRPTLECSNGNVWFISAQRLAAISNLVVQWGINRTSQNPSKPTRNRVFISCSPQDREWLQRLKTMLHPLIRNNTLSIWDNTQINAGDERQTQIESALSGAKVAVLLVSADFLESESVSNHLLPLLKKSQSEGVRVLWIPLKASLVEHTEVARFEPAYDRNGSLDGLDDADQNRALVAICNRVAIVAQS